MTDNNPDLDFEIEITREPRSTFDTDSDRAGYRIVGLDIFDSKSQAEETLQKLSSKLNDAEKVIGLVKELRELYCGTTFELRNLNDQNWWREKMAEILKKYDDGTLDNLKSKLANAGKNEQIEQIKNALDESEFDLFSGMICVEPKEPSCLICNLKKLKLWESLQKIKLILEKKE